MTIDWATLNSQTKEYRSLTADADPVSGLVTLNFCGLEVSMSEILAVPKTGGTHSLSVYADTVVMDSPVIDTTGLILVARVVDTTPLNGEPLVLNFSPGQGVVQLMVGESLGGPLQFAAKQGGAAVTPTLSTTNLTVNTYLSAESGADLNPVPGDNEKNVMELVFQSWALNSYMSGFEAATYLMDNLAVPEPETAQKLLAWITIGSSSLAAKTTGFPADYSQLYNQASALLVTLNVKPGAIFVPILSGDIYQNDLPALISVLSGYEADMNTLKVEKDISKAIETVSKGMSKSAQLETTPLKQRLSNIKANTTSLADDIQSLRQKFLLQQTLTKTSFDVMLTYISLSKIEEQLKAELSLAVSLFGTGIAAMKMEGDPSAISEVVKGGIESIKNGVEIIQSFIEKDGETGFGKTAVDLLKTQSALMAGFLNARTLWYNIEHDSSGAALPVNPSSVTIDPVTSWNNYQAQAEVQIASLQREAGSAVGRVDQYQANLKILIGYGKAIGAKYAAYIGQIVEATEVVSQIDAADKIAANWADIDKNASSQSQKLAALKALVLSRENVVKRSIFVSWIYYANSYFYLNFARPLPALTMDMSATEMSEALTTVSQWVEAALSTVRDGHVSLPSTDAHVELDFDISTDSNPSGASHIATVQKNDQGDWTILWVVNVGTDQLDGVLPNGGKCAIWITQAEFFLEGVTANSRGNLLSRVATSGTYENGFGLATNYVFAAKGLSGEFLYAVKGEGVYSPWKVDNSVYMTPSPYTQWQMTIPSDGGDPSTATKLKMKLKIAYATPS